MLNILENIEKDRIKWGYSGLVNARYGKNAGAKKSAEFCRKIDDLAEYAFVLKNSATKITEDHKKNILIMYQAILKQMKQEVRGNEIFTFRSALWEIEQDVNNILNPLPGDDMNKLLGKSAADNPGKIIPEKINESIQIYTFASSNVKLYWNLDKFKYSMEASNRAIYGRPSPQYTKMEEKLNQLHEAAGHLSNALYVKGWEKEDWDKGIANYNNILGELKTAAENYYLYKMNATHGGTKANKREKSRMNLAKLILHVINGEDLATACEMIPEELKMPTPDRDKEIQKKMEAVLAL